MTYNVLDVGERLAGLDRPLGVISLGAGVQSTTLAVKALRGELDEPVDAAVFADTGWEPKAVYRHLWRLAGAFLDAGIPLYVNSKGNIREDALDPTHRFASMPLYVLNVEEVRRPTAWRPCPTCAGDDVADLVLRLPGDLTVSCTTCDDEGIVPSDWTVEHRQRRGIMRRQCTNEYKLRAIRQVTWRLHNATGRPGVRQLIGISTDELGRMRDSDLRYVTNVYPLVAMGLSRADCEEYLAGVGWSAPRSACIGCPYHSDDEWLDMRDDPERHDEWLDAVAFDEAIRGGNVRLLNNRAAELNGQAFLHAARVPLAEVNLVRKADRVTDPAAASALALFGDEDGFGEECLGMCGN